MKPQKYPQILLFFFIFFSACLPGMEEISVNIPFPNSTWPQEKSFICLLRMDDYKGVFTAKDLGMVEKNQIFTHWAGRWPHFENGKPKFGGLPQTAEWDVHEKQFRRVVDLTIPDKEWNGYAVIDMEHWHPLWEEMTWGTRLLYKQRSRDKVKKEHPNFSPEAIEEFAKKEYEAGARNIMVRTLRLGKEMRPNAKWGYYGFPTKVYWNKEKGSGKVGPSEKHAKMNDQLVWLWKESTAIYPSIYLPYPSKDPAWTERNTEFVRENVKEAVRMAQTYHKVPVIAYAWHRYHPSGPNPKQLVSSEDLRLQFETAKEAGADGAVLWISDRSEEGLRELKNLWNKTFPFGFR